MVFGRLTVISKRMINYSIAKFLCECSCGAIKEYWSTSLYSGATKSCGCYAREVCSRTFKKHGHVGNNHPTRTYLTWENMKQRCLNPKYTHYSSYGGRGIRICKRWYRFTNFLEDMGIRPKNKTLDRINNNGDYKPSNCRWATKLQQMNNTRKQEKTK